jgi:Flp pilus assembly protein TadB
MDILQLLKKSYAQTTADRLQEQMAWSKEIKAQEEADSQRRMARMMAEEQARLQELARRRAAQKQKDQQLFLLLALFVLILIAVAVVATFLF